MARSQPLLVILQAGGHEEDRHRVGAQPAHLGRPLDVDDQDHADAAGAVRFDLAARRAVQLAEDVGPLQERAVPHFLLEAEPSIASRWAQELAQRNGPVVMPQWLTPDDISAEKAYYSLEWLVTERSISVGGKEYMELLGGLVVRDRISTGLGVALPTDYITSSSQRTKLLLILHTQELARRGVRLLPVASFVL